MKRISTMWQERLDNLLHGSCEEQEFAKANVEAIKKAVNGQGPDSSTIHPDAGVRTVFNISSVHAPAFCNASNSCDPKPYKNCYDLINNYRLGGDPPRVSKTREKVDKALPLNNGDHPEDVYFGAVELNGAGIRFYGDLCLVLSQNEIPGNTVVLDRNSYDLMRSPIQERIKNDCDRKLEASKLSGTWEDLGIMAAIKAIQILGLRNRRYTTGQIAEAIRDDEDYIEVLKINSFGTNQLQEVRVSSTEAAHDAWTGNRLLSGPVPRWESILWMVRRQIAEQELRNSGIRVRVITTSGRTKD